MREFPMTHHGEGCGDKDDRNESQTCHVAGRRGNQHGGCQF